MSRWLATRDGKVVLCGEVEAIVLPIENAKRVLETYRRWMEQAKADPDMAPVAQEFQLVVSELGGAIYVAESRNGVA